MTDITTRQLIKLLLGLAVLTSVLAIGALPSAAGGDIRDYSTGTEYNANYGLRSKLEVGSGDVLCLGPGPGFVYFGVWQGANAGDPWWYVETGHTDCDASYANDPRWIWGECKGFGNCFEHDLGPASEDITNTYKIFSNKDGKYRVFINGGLMATTSGWPSSSYYLNDGSVGLEVVNQWLSWVDKVRHRSLKAWPSRTYNESWDGDECRLDSPAGGRWLFPDTWRVDYNYDAPDEVCP